MYVLAAVSRISVAAYSWREDDCREMSGTLSYGVCSGASIAAWRAVFGAYKCARFWATKRADLWKFGATGMIGRDSGGLQAAALVRNPYNYRY